MESSFLWNISRLNLESATVLAIAGMLMFYFCFCKKVHILMFLITLSAASVGSTISVVDNVAALLRWLSIFALLAAGILVGRIQLSFGLLLFWGYVFLGFAFVLRAISISWQFQKSSLLILVALGITMAFSINTLKAYKASLSSIAVAASIYSVLSFLPLSSYLSNPARYAGYAKGAADFAVSLGALLPFAFWGFWQAESRLVRIASGLGFLLGAASLLLSGQRAGLVTGLLGLVPLLLAVVKRNRKAAVRVVLLLILAFLLIYLLFVQSSAARKHFLVNRYSLDYGLSKRDMVWRDVISIIVEDPLLGRGIGGGDVGYGHSFHNAYLEVWFNTGFLGLVLFVTSQFYFLYRTIHLSRITEDVESKSILALALGYMVGFVALCLVESKGAGASNISMILYLFLGVLVSNDRLLSSGESEQVGATST